MSFADDRPSPAPISNLALARRVEVGPLLIARRILAVICSLLIHVILLGGGAVAAAIVLNTSGVRAMPREPLLVMAVALVMAHCSLGAIWWVRTSWPPHAKTLVAAISTAGLWLLLIGLLDTTRQNGVAASAWAASVMTQALFTAIAVTGLELRVHYESAAARSRFSLLFLMIWTSVAAVLLGVAGALAARAGFKLADVPAWGFFQQLQGVAIASAVLAAGVYASVRLPSTWTARALGCTAVIITIAAATPMSLFAIFGINAGASVTDIVWLMTGQGAFLAATLFPLEIARDNS